MFGSIVPRTSQNSVAPETTTADLTWVRAFGTSNERTRSAQERTGLDSLATAGAIPAPTVASTTHETSSLRNMCVLPPVVGQGEVFQLTDVHAWASGRICLGRA